MDYEKKYKEAFERARIWQNHLYDTNDKDYADELNYIFPELAESEDKKIRKQILGFLKEFERDHYRSLNFSTWIAWLEKQESCYSFKIKKGHWYKCVCDYMLNNSDLMFKNDRLYYCRSDWRLRGEIDERNVKNIGVNGYKSFFRPATNQEIKEWLEKQGEQKQDVNVQINPSEYINNIGGNGCYLKNATQTSTCSKKEEKVNNQNCVKSIYDVKPKFKVGDWISNDMCDVHIASIEDGMYYFDEGDGLSIVFVDEHYHLWTIEDAMDGDVLIDKSNGREYPFIFKETKSSDIKTDCLNPLTVLGYCGIGGAGFTKGSGWGDTANCMYYPATKEQRDTLFAKMKEAGWEWDAEKKELKKIETEIEIPFGAKDSELQEATYYIPKGFHAEINDDKVVIKKGENPTAWSEEDETRLTNTIIMLKEGASHHFTNFSIVPCVNWLKSIKQRIGG